MGKTMEWFKERPDMMIVIPFVVMLLSLILAASFPRDSIATMIFALISNPKIEAFGGCCFS
jgi:hypothetical protein